MTAGISNAFLAGDLFNLYVGFEVLLAASFVLLTLGASADRVRAGVSYVMVSMVSSLIFLAGIAFAYAATGTLNMADMALRFDNIPPGTRTAIFAVLLVAFGIKPRFSRCPRGYRTRIRPRPHRSPPSSPGCSPRSVCTRSSAHTHCCSRKENSTTY